MKEQDSSFSPEAIDALTGREPGKQLLPDEQRLIRDVYSLSREYASENERSLERIWNRLVQQGQEQPARIQQQETGTPGLFREGKAMPQKDIYQELLEERRQQGNYQEREFSTLDSQPVKRAGRSRWRALGMSAAAAVVVLTILSWAVLSAGLHLHRQHTPVAQNQQTSLRTASLRCSFPDNNSQVTFTRPSLGWSATGQISVTYGNLRTFSAQNCAPSNLASSDADTEALWSPDGKRLLVLGGITAPVLDASTGKVIATYPATQNSTSTSSARVPTAGLTHLSSFSGGGPNSPNPSDVIDEAVWSADSTQIVAVATKYTAGSASGMRVVIWNASTGKLVRVAMTLNPNLLLDWLSPDGKYIALQAPNHSIEIWNIATNQQVSIIPFNPSVKVHLMPAPDLEDYEPSAVAWSPDSSLIALGQPQTNEIQIWSTTSGRLISSFQDGDAITSDDKGTTIAMIGDLAWSPDGKYLAESSSNIHIWDVKAQKMILTFGKVDPKYWVTALAWSPDSKMLTSIYNGNIWNGSRPANTGEIWQLS